MTARRTDAESQRSLAALALCADEALLDLLLEDGLVPPAEAHREHTASQLLSLLRRIFGETASEPPQRASNAKRPHRELSATRIALRAPPKVA